MGAEGAAGQLRLSLRFLSGKHQGSEYVLDDPTELVVGRSGDVGLILVEGMVSRRHARFQLASGKLSVEDLGSTNGTFVNGDKIRHRDLQQGDRVLIGTTILKVVFSELPAGTKPPPPAARPSNSEDVQTADRNGMSGRLDEVAVPELLEMFGSSRQRLVLSIDSPRGAAKVWISNGRVLDCRIKALGDAPALKCIHRVLGFEQGSFSVLRFAAPDEVRLDRPIPELLVDGLFKLDETTVLRQRLPQSDERLVMAKPIVAPLRALDEPLLDLLQIAHNLGAVDAILDATPETDLEAAGRLLTLVDRGYLRKA